MDIRQFRVAIRAKNFERTTRFYGDVMGLPRLQTWEREDARGALFQVGSGVVEVQGRLQTDDNRGWDEAYDYQGPGTEDDPDPGCAVGGKGMRACEKAIDCPGSRPAGPPSAPGNDRRPRRE